MYVNGKNNIENLKTGVERFRREIFEWKIWDKNVGVGLKIKNYEEIRNSEHIH